ncbi:CMRF35-like molecule 8 [Pygocentrus nattereri]|uniref:Immunoglobulin domain-containing protein n=1 Tax=Pygocentrus nattereri TaxID=42514 RepID=A0AAR2KT95_PYGNA|nr:CMRF35-like molecule 8 [Pygocentrus nattereri]
MKILLIFTLHLISGGAAGTDVIGFLGGRVTINFKHNVYDPEVRQVFFCKAAECEIIIYDQRNRWILKDRFHLYGDFHQALTVTFKQLSSEDAGTYQYGENNQLKHQFNLQLISDLCCLGPNTMTGYVGETITISFSYPEQFESHTKYFYKLDDLRFNIMIGTTETQKGRFYMSDNRESKVFSVRISNVTEDDGGVYYCGVWNEGESVSYQSLYTEIQLQVTEKSSQENPESPTDSEQTDSTNTIIVCVCVALLLLLIGGLALMFCRRMKAKGSTSSSNNKEKGSDSEMSPAVCDYEDITDIRPQPDSESTPVYATIQPPKAPSGPLNSVYATVQHPTTPSGPPNSVYATAQFPTNPSDSPNTVYATVQSPTMPSDPPSTVYATAQSPKIPTNPYDPPNTVYATAQLPTMPSNQSPKIPSDTISQNPSDSPTGSNSSCQWDEKLKGAIYEFIA